MKAKVIGRAAIGAGIIAVLLGLWAPAASAHVTINPREAAQGGYAKLSFRVPNERDAASTTKVAVQFPQDHVIPSVSVRPTPGWNVEVKKRTLETPITSGEREVREVVDTITWSGGQIKPGEFQEFDVSGGTLPTDTDQLVFPAIQTYDNGEEVAWIEKPTTGGEELERPAPVLKLTPSASGHGSASPGTTAGPVGTTVSAQQQTASATPASSTSSSSSSAVAWVGVALGAIALLAAIAALARGNRSASA